ncbi:MAG: hypothetical protein HYV02_02400 [Deltaproteobacteria bacterium]|nr:hypothetical protein [Deltaproteobacteria bacterium]
MRHRWCWSLCLLLLCVGCEKKDLYSDLEQNDANEILVLLTQHGIQATLAKEVRQNQTSYNVRVDDDDMDQARGLLQEHNLPRSKRPGLHDIFQEPGFIPTPQEQRARFLLAIEGEVVNALQKIPDVVDADVNVTLPSQEEFGSEQTPERPTASVVLKVRPTEQAVATLTEAKIQRFVANSVEKLDPRDVTVILTYTGEPAGGILPGQSLILPSIPSSKKGEKPAIGSGAAAGETVTVVGLSIRPESAGRLKLYIGIFLGLLAILSLGLVVMVVQASRMRQGRDESPPALEGGELPPQLGAGRGE